MNLKWKFKPNMDIFWGVLIAVVITAAVMIPTILFIQANLSTPGAAADSSLAINPKPPPSTTSVSPDLTELAPDGDTLPALPPLLYYPLFYCPTTRTQGYQMPDGTWRVVAFYEQTRSRLILWDEEDVR